MRALEELKRTDPKWSDALARLLDQVADHLLSQRIGGIPGRVDVALNWGAGPKPPLKIELRPVKVITS